jgi:hypothetical protein
MLASFPGTTAEGVPRIELIGRETGSFMDVSILDK